MNVSAIDNENYDSENSIPEKQIKSKHHRSKSHICKNTKSYNKDQYELQERIVLLEKELRHYKDQPDLSDTAALKHEIERISQKKESDKLSFQKRVKEFELILRYLEERIIKTISKADADKDSSKMNSLIHKVSSRNPTLNMWLTSLCSKLENFADISNNQAVREKTTYLEIAKTLTCLANFNYIASEFSTISYDLELGIVNLDSVSIRLVSAIKACLIAVNSSSNFSM